MLLEPGPLVGLAIHSKAVNSFSFHEWSCGLTCSEVYVGDFRRSLCKHLCGTGQECSCEAGVPCAQLFAF